MGGVGFAPVLWADAHAVPQGLPLSGVRNPCCDRTPQGRGRSKVNYDGAGRVAAGRQVESLFESLLSQSFEGGR
jgi:hypothetical protein